jgi:hypothetical protein
MKNWTNIKQLFMTAAIWSSYIEGSKKWQLYLLFIIGFIVMFFILGIWDLLLILVSNFKILNHGN